MDIYDVIQALRRQWVVLTVGIVLLVGLVGFSMFTIDNGKPKPRLAPRYEATSQMVVVPADIEELTNPRLTSSEFASVADVYAGLLATERAAAEINERTGARIDAITVSSSSGAPVIIFVVESPTADEAVLAAVGAFDWLEDRLQAGGTLAAIARDEGPAPTETNIDAEQIVIFSEPAFDIVDRDIWIEFTGPEGTYFATPLYRLESGTFVDADVEPGQNITITVGPETGQPHDTVRLFVPPIEAEALPPLEIRLRRGSVEFDETGIAALNRAAFSTAWQPLPADPEVESVTVMLLDDEPVPIQIGQQRGPIIAGGALAAGLLLLFVFALMRDTWQTRRRAAEPAVVLVPDHAEAGAEPEEQANVGAIQPWEYRRARE